MVVPMAATPSATYGIARVCQSPLSSSPNCARTRPCTSPRHRAARPDRAAPGGRRAIANSRRCNILGSRSWTLGSGGALLHRHRGGICLRRNEVTECCGSGRIETSRQGRNVIAAEPPPRSLACSTLASGYPGQQSAWRRAPRRGMTKPALPSDRPGQTTPLAAGNFYAELRARMIKVPRLLYHRMLER